jgi:hypothetical protein
MSMVWNKATRLKMIFIIFLFKILHILKIFYIILITYLQHSSTYSVTKAIQSKRYFALALVITLGNHPR